MAIQDDVHNLDNGCTSLESRTDAYRRCRESATTCVRTAISYLMKRLHSRDVILGLILSTACFLAACTTGPGAGIRWTNYPALASSTTSYPWLVVKCQVSDVPTIPTGLDTNIQQFFGISGAGYGNIVDYFHDVSYNRASVISDTFVGWIRAPFNKADLSFPSGRLRNDRAQRVKECLQAIPADQLPDLDAFFGVVVINNAVQDGGACFQGQQSMTINNKSYKLACDWFDPNSLLTGFAPQEMGHGLGLTHSFDDSGRNCGGKPGEYCDPWDVMSAFGTYRFVDPNWLVTGLSGGGPGLNAPNLLRMGWIPAGRRSEFQLEGDNEQAFTIRALSHPKGSDPLVVTLDVGSAEPFGGLYTVEYRQGDGWDRGFVSNTDSPQAVRSSGGAVFVHQYRPAGEPASTLINGAFAGALQPCNTLVLVGLGGATFYVTVKSFDIADGSATVSIGRGRGKFVLACFRNAITNPVDSPAHIHIPPDARIQP